MTTVVYDGKTIACDSQVSWTGNQSCKGTVQKGRIINTPTGKVLLIGTGILDEYLDALVAIQEGKIPTLTENESELLLVRDGKVHLLTAEGVETAEKPRRVPVELRTVHEPGAWGSGSTFGQVLLRMGGDAVQGVAMACAMDLFSGGKIHAWDVETLAKVKTSNKCPRVAK